MLKEAGFSFKFKSITSGWKNYFFENDKAELIAKSRAVICSGCPFAVKGWFDEYIDDRIESIQGMVCDKCSCPLSAKLRSEDSFCPENKW